MQLPVLSTLCAQQGHSNTPFQPGSQEALEKSHSQAEANATHMLNIAVIIYYHALNYSQNYPEYSRNPFMKWNFIRVR